MIKPQSVGFWGFVATVAGYLLILGCSQWFAPGLPAPRTDAAGSPGQLRRAALTGAVALVATLLVPAGRSRLRPGHLPAGLPAQPVGNRHRPESHDHAGQQPADTGRQRPDHLRHQRHRSRCTCGPSRWTISTANPGARTTATASRLPLGGPIDPGYAVLADEQQRQVTAIDTGTFSSPYLPAPYAPETVRGLNGRWTWDPATLSIKGSDTTASRRQEYMVTSSVPNLTAALLAQSSAPVRDIPDDFTRIPGNVPDIVRTTAEARGRCGRHAV